MTHLTITEVSRQSGLQASTIRYYEAVGLLPLAIRVNGRRRYNVQIFRQIAIIRLAQQAGFSIAEIHTLLHGFPTDTKPSERWHLLAQHKMKEITRFEEQIGQMRRILEKGLMCSCSSLDDCLLFALDTPGS